MEPLLSILSKNSKTEIGKRWNFEGISSIEAFQQQVPLTDYNVYKPYIDRIAEHGEQHLLTSDAVIQFAPSSGTTGEMKLIPVPGIKSMPGPSASDRVLMLTSLPDDRSHTTPSGIYIQAVLVRMLQQLFKTYPNSYAAPPEAYDISSIPVALYIQLVFGLRDVSINVIRSTFIPVFVSALTELMLKWPQMVRDIETGQLDPSLPITVDERVVLEKLLGGPDPDQASRLREIFSQAEKSKFKDVIPAIWPNLKVVKCLCSGNLRCFIPTVRHYIGSDIHILSYMYGCSEFGICGLPVRPLTETSLFHLAPGNFYEFIPLDKSQEDQPKTLLPSEIEAGRIYELVVTTPMGFYRYRNGDYIKVVEQGEGGPLIDFHGRRAMTLNLREHILFAANIEEAMSVLTKATASRVDYCVSVDEKTYSKYIVWLECEGLSCGIDKELDESLQNVDETYKYDREHDKVDQLIVVRVKAGTFSKILAFMKSNTVSIEAQLKIPRIVVHDRIRTILTEGEL